MLSYFVAAILGAATATKELFRSEPQLAETSAEILVDTNVAA